MNGTDECPTKCTRVPMPRKVDSPTHLADQVPGINVSDGRNTVFRSKLE
jgi:hypothetical protein